MTDPNHLNDSNYPTVSFFMNAVSIALMTLCSVYLFNFQCPSLTPPPRNAPHHPAQLPQAEVASFCFLIHLAQYIAHILLNKLFKEMTLIIFRKTTVKIVIKNTSVLFIISK